MNTTDLQLALNTQPLNSANSLLFSVQSIQDEREFARLRSEWDELLDDSLAGIFNSWEWLYPWYKHIGSVRKLHLLAARDIEGRLVGLLSLCVENRRAAGRTLRRASFLGDSHVGSDYLDVVARRGYRRDVTHALMSYARDNPAWDVLDLLDMDSESPTLPVVREVFPQTDFVVEEGERFVCPYEEFAPDQCGETFLRGTGRYDNFVRRRKWLEKQPGYEIERTIRSGELAGPVAEFMKLHAQRWECEGGSMGITGPEVEAFHYDASRLLAERGQICFYTMRVGGKAVASVYGILHKDKFLYYQSGRDPQWHNRSVGMVLIGDTFRHAFELGLREYDFLRGLEAYKLDWVTQQRTTIAVRIYPKGGTGAWLTRHERAEQAARSLVKKALPSAMVQWLRRRG